MRPMIVYPPSLRRNLPLAIMLALAGCNVGNAPRADGTAASNALQVPVNYHSTFEPAGVWSVAADTGSGAKEIHIVYASPGALDAYRRAGSYPDGSVLVKEVFTATTSPMTTGTASQPTSLKGWFVMVRDSKSSHLGDNRWGDGWGWGWIDAAKPQQNATVDYRSECLGCHEPARATQLSYTHGYPQAGR